MTALSPVKTVFLIDDDQIYTYALKKLIGSKQCSPVLHEFSNGKAAYDFLVDPQNVHDVPDIIFLDINMPVMDGWKFMEHYVQIKPQLGKKINIYMLSSSICEMDKTRARNITEVSEYIVKPVTKDKVAQLLELVS